MYVTYAVALALVKIGDKRASDPLTQLLNDKSKLVQEEATASLRKIKLMNKSRDY